jgi:uncharacterized protein with PQ loop repeat
MVSNLIWLVSSTPQYIQNCETKTVDGQSPFYFSLLFTGNVCSLIGLLVNGGLATQIIQAIIYVILDGILFAQYLYYRYMYYGCCHDHFADLDGGQPLDDDDDNAALAIDGGVIIAGAASAAVNYAAPYSGKELVGTIFGWISTTIYVGSRIPQLKKNFTTKMVKDVNPLYIVFAVLGNFTYLLSLWIKDISAQYNWNQAPWIIGAGFPMLADITALIQMAVYGRGETEPENNESHTEEVDNEAESTVRMLTEL